MTGELSGTVRTVRAQKVSTPLRLPCARPTLTGPPRPQPPHPPLASKALLAAAVGTPRPSLTWAAIEAGEIQAAFLWQDRQPGEKVQRLEGLDAWGLAHMPTL